MFQTQKVSTLRILSTNKHDVPHERFHTWPPVVGHSTGALQVLYGNASWFCVYSVYNMTKSLA